MLLDVIQVWLPLCNSAVLVTMIYGVVVKDVDSSMSMGGRYALRRPYQATLGPIRTERAGVEIPAQLSSEHTVTRTYLAQVGCKHLNAALTSP